MEFKYGKEKRERIYIYSNRKEETNINEPYRNVWAKL